LFFASFIDFLLFLFINRPAFSPFSLSYALQYTSFAHQNYFSFSAGVNYYYKRYKGGVKYKYNNLASSEFSGVNLSLGVTF